MISVGNSVDEGGADDVDPDNGVCAVGVGWVTLDRAERGSERIRSLGSPLHQTLGLDPLFGPDTEFSPVSRKICTSWRRQGKGS